MLKQFYIFVLFIPCIAFTQENNRLNVEFSKGDFVYANPLTGGFEAPQFYEIDLDIDGVKDLLVFDRKGGAMRTFLYDADSAFKCKYAPEYESNFPNVLCWLKVRDYNNDGIDDLFTCGVTNPVTGIEVWTGYEDNGKINFKVYNHGPNPYNIIYYEQGFNSKQFALFYVSM